MLRLEMLPALNYPMHEAEISDGYGNPFFNRRMTRFNTRGLMGCSIVHVDGLCERCGHWHMVHPNPPPGVCSASNGRR